MYIHMFLHIYWVLNPSYFHLTFSAPRRTHSQMLAVGSSSCSAACCPQRCSLECGVRPSENGLWVVVGFSES